jgi:putative ABC transport system substrate-binding protein
LRRREFLGVPGGATAVWPLAARAQQPAMPAAGYLYSGTPDANPHFGSGFRRGLTDTGY